MAASTAEHDRAPVSSLSESQLTSKLPHQPKGVVYIDSEIPTPTSHDAETPPPRAVDADASEYYGGQPVHSRARTLSNASPS